MAEKRNEDPTMSVRRGWIVLIFALCLLGFGVAAALYALPGLVRHVAMARIQAITNRPVAIAAVDLRLLPIRLTVRGFHLADRESGTPFADFEQLDLRVDLLPLLRGHLRIRDAVLRNPTVRVVRSAQGFNFSDLIQASGTTRRALDVTVDRFALLGGTVTLEDRALPEVRTWASKQIRIEAHNVSTRRDDGTAVGTSVTAGAPMRIELQNLRLYPIHLRATLTAEGVDLGLARLYLPPDARVVIDGGRATSSLTVALDASTGVRAEGTGQLEDVVLVRPGEREPAARVPKLTAQFSGFAFQDGRLQLGRVDVVGSASVRDPRVGQRTRYQVSTMRATIADLTWPATTPGRLDVMAAIPGGGTLALSGTVQPPPAPSRLRLRVANLDLAPWAQFLPVAAQIEGTGEADLHLDAPLAVGVPTRVEGTIAVNRLGVRDARQELLGTRRLEATGVEVEWPTRLAIRRLLVREPRAMVERDADGSFPLQAVLNRPASASGATPHPTAGDGATAATPSLGLVVGEIVVRGGTVAWRDRAVTPPVALGVSDIESRVTGAGWPLRGPLEMRAALRPPGGGQIRVAGRIGLEPLTADVRVGATDAELGPYHPYVPTAARINGRADLDVSVNLPGSWPEGTTVRGTAALSRVDVRDEQRTVIRIDQAAATGLDLQWPHRASVRQLTLQRPWILLERDEAGVLPLPTLLVPPSGPGSATKSASGRDQGVAARGAAEGGTAEGRGQMISVAVGRLVVEDGGARVVDRGVSPPFAVDLQRLAAQVDGLSTAQTGKPAVVELTGRAGAGSLLSLRGTVGPLGGPLRVNMSGELRDFAVPRTNPYLMRQVAWEARDGWLRTSLQCRIDGDALEAKTDIRLSRLQVARAGAGDESQARIGLPLGMIVALMKDRAGEINLSLPVGGRLTDPRFDFSEAIWSTLRNVAIKAITLPVSWIGRVHLGADSRVQRIEVDPIPFEPGATTPTPEGQEQATRLAAFLAELPEARMTLTPVVSARDLTELKRRTTDAAITRLTRDGGLSASAAAARLFQERFPGRTPPEAPEAIRAALVQIEPAAPGVAAGLAAQRVETLRAMMKKAGIDPTRLVEAPAPEDPAGAEEGIQLDLAEPPESPRQSGQRLPETLRRLLGRGAKPASE
jgi:hypothetical protein